jgi:hypothetical protein
VTSETKIAKSFSFRHLPVGAKTWSLRLQQVQWKLVVVGPTSAGVRAIIYGHYIRHIRPVCKWIMRSMARHIRPQAQFSGNIPTNDGLKNGTVRSSMLGSCHSHWIDGLYLDYMWVWFQGKPTRLINVRRISWPIKETTLSFFVDPFHFKT